MIFVLPAILLIGSKVSFLEGFVVGVGGALFGICNIAEYAKKVCGDNRILGIIGGCIYFR